MGNYKWVGAVLLSMAWMALAQAENDAPGVLQSDEPTVPGMEQSLVLEAEKTAVPVAEPNTLPAESLTLFSTPPLSVADSDRSKSKIPRGLKKTLMISGNFGSANYVMEDINVILSDWDSYLQYNRVPKLDRLKGGDVYQGSMTYWLTQNIGFSLEVETLGAKIKGGDSTLGMDLNLTALEMGGQVKYGKRSGSHIFSAGLGIYSICLMNASQYVYWGKLGYYDSYRSFKGSGTSMKVCASYEYCFTPHLGVGGDVGYRSATIKNAHWTGMDEIDQPLKWNDKEISIDYSGFFVRTGIRFYLF